MWIIYVDADACPVKEEIYRVALRYQMPVQVVCNAWMRVPRSPLIELVVCREVGLNIVDDWIAERAGPGDIVVTSDIPLAARCIQHEARVLDAKGRELTSDDIGETLAMRNLFDELRQTGAITGGPRPLAGRDVSQFLSKLDELIHWVKRRYQKS